MSKAEKQNKEAEKQNKEAEIRALISSLDAPTSPIGDWKIVKIYEARLRGEEDPYNYKELAEARQCVRDRINELQEQLEQDND